MRARWYHGPLQQQLLLLQQLTVAAGLMLHEEKMCALPLCRPYLSAFLLRMAAVVVRMDQPLVHMQLPWRTMQRRQSPSSHIIWTYQAMV